MPIISQAKEIVGTQNYLQNIFIDNPNTTFTQSYYTTF